MTRAADRLAAAIEAERAADRGHREACGKAGDAWRALLDRLRIAHARGGEQFEQFADPADLDEFKRDGRGIFGPCDPFTDAWKSAQRETDAALVAYRSGRSTDVPPLSRDAALALVGNAYRAACTLETGTPTAVEEQFLAGLYDGKAHRNPVADAVAVVVARGLGLLSGDPR